METNRENETREGRERRSKLSALENGHQLHCVHLASKTYTFTDEQYQFLLASWVREITGRQYRGTFEEYLQQLKGGR